MRTGDWLARRRFLWRDYWARRSRQRAIATIACVVAAVFIAALILAPVAWLTAAGSWMSALSGWAYGVAPRTVAVVGIVALLLVGLALALTPPMTRRMVAPYGASIGATAIAPISVYVDAENQPPVSLLPAFIDRLRGHLRGRRADLLYYADAQRQGAGDRYVNLRRYGFSPVDVAHNPFESRAKPIKPTLDQSDQNIKNMVDMEMSLQAARRSWYPPNRQEIILVTGDLDFIPLIYHLLADGHSVQIWASRLSPIFFNMQRYLERFTAVELGPVVESAVVDRPGGDTTFTSEVATSPGTASISMATTAHPQPPRTRGTNRPAWNRRPQRYVRYSATQRGAVPTTQPMSATARIKHELASISPDEDALFAAIRLTLIALNSRADAKGTATFTKSQLFSLVSQTLPVLSERLGYYGTHYAACWLLHLQHAGAIRITWPSDAGGLYSIVAGADSSDTAAERLRRFVRLVADTAIALKSATGQTSLPLNTLLNTVFGTSGQLPSDLRELMTLLEPYTRHPEETSPVVHVRFFCRCALKLHMLAVDEGELMQNRLIFVE